MRLAEAEKLAREALAEDLKYTECNYAHDAMVLMHRSVARNLARALLAVVPVVRAADAWVSADEGEDDREADRLTFEVIKMRRDLEGK